ncbi:MAG: ACT domain-containing protein [Burkholderiaceae bacterium]
MIDEDEVSGKLRIGVHIRDRTHLAQLMRSLRNLDVIRSVRRG